MNRLALIFLLALPFASQALAAGEPRRFESTVTQPVAFDYLLYLPDGYDAAPTAPAWPLVLFLHGSGSFGEKLDLVREGGLPKQLETGLKCPRS